MKFFLRFVSTTLAIIIAGYVLDPGVHFNNYLSVIILALVLGLLTQFVKPLLVLLTLPATIISFGLFLLVINTVIILIAEQIVNGFSVRNFWWAMLFGIIISILSNLIQRLIYDDKINQHDRNYN